MLRVGHVLLTAVGTDTGKWRRPVADTIKRADLLDIRLLPGQLLRRDRSDVGHSGVFSFFGKRTACVVQDSGSRQKTAGTLSVYYNKPAGVFQRIIPPLPSIFPLFPHFSANPRGKLSILYKKQFIFPQTGNIIIHMGEIQTDFLPISHRIGAITLAHPDRPDGAKGWAYQWKHRRFCRVSGGFILSASAARVCVRWPKSSMPWGTRSPVPMTWSRTTWPA